jgi:uncharacterized membrane protein YebE (DUF533 family)
MIDFEKILADLQTEAAKVAEAVELEKHLEQGKDIANDAMEQGKDVVANVRERLDADPKARLAAAGAGGLLLAGLLGTRGGRNILGGVAKTGAVAALGALAYRTWQGRREASEGEEVAAHAAGYVLEADSDPNFSEAIVRVMIAAAYADGILDEVERTAINAELDRMGASAEERALLATGVSDESLYEAIVYSARSPNHAAQLYAAASVVAGVNNDKERMFLAKLADRLGVDHRHAAAMNNAAAG